jgi:hypothetical protein
MEHFVSLGYINKLLKKDKNSPFHIAKQTDITGSDQLGEQQ